MKIKLIWLFTMICLSSIHSADTLEVMALSGGGYGYAFVSNGKKLKEILEIEIDQHNEIVGFTKRKISKSKKADSIYQKIYNSKPFKLKNQSDLENDSVITADGSWIKINYRSNGKTHSIQYVNPNMHDRTEDKAVANIWGQVLEIRETCLAPSSSILKIKKNE